MKWSELSIHTTNEAIEAVSNIMHEAGASGVVIEDSEDLTKEREYRFGEIYSLDPDDFPVDGVILKATMVTNTLDPQVCFAESGLGIACVAEIAVRRQLQQGSLITVLDDFNHDAMVFNVLWPSGRHLSPRIRVFVDFIVENLFPL